MANVKIYKCPPHISELAHTVSDIYKLKKLIFRNIGQSQGAQLAKWHQLVANAKIYNCLPYVFCASSHSFRDINILRCWFSKSRLRSLSIILATTPLDVKCQNLQKTATHFRASSYRYRDIRFCDFGLWKVCQVYGMQFSYLHHLMANVTSCFSPIFAILLQFQRYQLFNVWPLKSRSRSRSAVFEMTPFDGKCQSLQIFSTHFLRLFLPYQRYNNCRCLTPWQTSKSSNVFHLFCASFHRFRDINMLRSWPSKSISRLRSMFLATISFDSKCNKKGKHRSCHTAKCNMLNKWLKRKKIL